MAQLATKTYRIVKQKQHRQSLNECRKFKIRPPIFQMPMINIHAHFTRFKVQVKNLKFQPFGSKRNDFTPNKQDLSPIKLENQPNKIQKKGSTSGSDKKMDDIEFLRNRNSIHYIDKINLIELSLDKVISYFFSEGLMLNEYYSKYTKQRESNKNSKKQLFVPIDHRIFSQMLVKYFSNNYTIETKKNQQSIDQLYQIPIQQYFDSWDMFNKNNNRIWLPKGKDLLNDPSFFRKQHVI